MKTIKVCGAAFIFEVYSMSSTLRRSCLQWYAQQFPWMYTLYSFNKKSSYFLRFDVHEKSLTEGECELK